MTFKELLIRHEGLKLKPYRCTAGKWTIGVGRNLEDVGLTREEVIFLLQEGGFTNRVAMLLLDNDIERTIKECRTFPWFEQLDNVRQAVVASMVFNLGLSKFRLFVRTRAAIEAGDYVKAAAEMKHSVWFEQVGNRGPELVEMMRTGKG